MNNNTLYRKYIKRILDIAVSGVGITVLSPVYLALTVTGAISMRGNPFFVQPRPGKNEKIFNIIKFRSMNNRRDKQGNLLPDEQRLTAYGNFLRNTSLDELPELFNIFIGDMSVVGPRPLLPEYIPYYTPEEHRRHSVRPGLTGLAQVNGRNYMTWETKFALDLEYIDTMSFLNDLKILLKTVEVTLKHSDIETASVIKHDGMVIMPMNIEREMKKKTAGETDSR